MFGCCGVTTQVLPPSLDVAVWSKGAADGSRSPPPTIPCCGSLKDTLKSPALGEPRSGEAYASHVSPPSRVTRTLDGDAPPVTAHAFFLPCVATQVPLDAKKDSPGSAAGSLPAMLSHVSPFVVRTTGNCPLTESLCATPRVGVQKAKQS